MNPTRPINRLVTYLKKNKTWRLTDLTRDVQGVGLRESNIYVLPQIRRILSFHDRFQDRPHHEEVGTLRTKERKEQRDENPPLLDKHKDSL